MIYSFLNKQKPVFALFASALLLVSCGDNAKSVAKRVANRNGNEQALKIFEAYKPDTPQANAAWFLLANIEANHSLIDSVNRLIPDINAINADSVINSINQSFAVWDTVPWRDQYSFDQFCQYVLPYRVAYESLEYYWKEDCLRRFTPDGSTDIIQAAHHINTQIKLSYSRESAEIPSVGYSDIVNLRQGRCEHRSLLATMAFRGAGFPAAYEMIPYWGTTNSGHSLCSVIMPDGRSVIFDDARDRGNGPYFVNKLPKIYRKMFSRQSGTVIYKNRDRESIPSPFDNFDLMDVTTTHDVGFADMPMAIAGNVKNRVVWLAVFSPGVWYPVAYSANRGARTRFDAVGTGAYANGEAPVYGEDMGEGILYLPCICRDGRMIPIGEPLVHNTKGQKRITADTIHRQSVTLTRKYPRLNRIQSFATHMVGGVFEASSSPGFTDAVELHYVASVPLSCVQRVETDCKKACRFVRYRKPSGTLSVGEMKFYDDYGEQITGTSIACKALEGRANLGDAFDGAPLTYFSMAGLSDGWIGLRFDRPTRVAAIEFCPRTDDNDISPGDQYELLWWNGRWQSLGQRQAESYELTWSDVPSGALFWLRNLTKGREERPFTYENGKQIWW